MTRSTALTATAPHRGWDPAATRIERLELRLDLERTRAEIRDLRALVADHKHDNDCLRTILSQALREGPPTDAHVHAPHRMSVDVSIEPALPPASKHHAHEHGRSAASAIPRSSWGRPVGKSSPWLESRPPLQQEERAYANSQRPAIGRGIRSSCDSCTRSKIRCDGDKPLCGNCQQEGPRIAPYHHVQPHDHHSISREIPHPPLTSTARFYSTPHPVRTTKVMAITAPQSPPQEELHFRRVAQL